MVKAVKERGHDNEVEPHERDKRGRRNSFIACGASEAGT
jgi:hypothetical protein